MGKINENDKSVSDDRKKIGTEEMLDEFPPLSGYHRHQCMLYGALYKPYAASRVKH